MSAFLSIAPILERTAAANTSAFPEAPQLTGGSDSRPRFAMAAALRRVAAVELALAARLERRPTGHGLAPA